MSQTICFFGIYDPNYSRNLVLTEGFRSNGFEVITCRVSPGSYPGIIKYWQLFKLWRNLPSKPDLVLVAYPGQTVLWLARLLFPRQSIIFDAFTSLFDSNVSDRRLYSKWSWRGLRDFGWDYVSLRVAPIVLTDTEANAKYLQKTFRVKPSKFIRVFVGSTINQENQLATPVDKTEVFLVHFHGTFIPLQGIETVLRAAKLLESEPGIRFRIIGSGQESAKIASLSTQLKLTNVEFLPRINFSELAIKLQEAKVVLGIFGLTDKACRVIPNKVFEGLALGKAIITADTPAARELLINGETVLFCQAGDPADLARQIKVLVTKSDLLASLEQNTQKLFTSQLTPALLVARLIKDLESKN